MPRFLAAALLLSAGLAAPVAAEPYARWPPHLPRFESTGGGGVMIDEYRQS